MISGRSLGCMPLGRAAKISGQLGLQVKVMKRSGLPSFLTVAMASAYWPVMKRGPPVKVAGRMTRGTPMSVPTAPVTAYRELQGRGGESGLMLML